MSFGGGTVSGGAFGAAGGSRHYLMAPRRSPATRQFP